MRKLIFLLVLVFCFFSYGCLVSQAEFDKTRNEATDLRKKIEEKDLEINKVKNEVSVLINKISEQESEISELAKTLKITNEKLALYKSEFIGASGTPSLSENLSVEDEYIANFIDVYDINAKYFNAILDGKIPGIEFKIKNKGVKTVTDIKIVFYFKDSKDNIIFEDYYYPLAGSYSEP